MFLYFFSLLIACCGLSLSRSRQAGGALEYASDALRGDRTVVLAALAQDGYALLEASRALRGDREVVLAAVTQTGNALR